VDIGGLAYRISILTRIVLNEKRYGKHDHRALSGLLRRAVAGSIGCVEPVLMTERLVLRRLTAADADGLLALDGDPAVMRYIDSRIKSRAEIETEVLPRLLAVYERYRDYGHFAADTRDGEFIGWFGIRPVVPSADWMEHWVDAPEPARTAALGYRLRRSAWGRGYATEGAQALVRRAFGELGVEEVVATTMAVNARSRAVLAKAGLRYARTVHLTWDEPLPGNEHGDVEYRLCRADWEPKRGAPEVR
jgi:RimJ/RimL family protein N-acetyltransferase